MSVDSEVVSMLNALEKIFNEDLIKNAATGVCELYEAVLNKVPDAPTHLKLKKVAKGGHIVFEVTWVELLAKVKVLHDLTG